MDGETGSQMEGGGGCNHVGLSERDKNVNLHIILI